MLGDVLFTQWRAVTTTLGAMSAPEQMPSHCPGPLPPMQTPTANVCVESDVPPWMACDTAAALPSGGDGSADEHPAARTHESAAPAPSQANLIEYDLYACLYRP